MKSPLRHALDQHIIILAGALMMALPDCSGINDAPPTPVTAAVTARPCPPWVAYPLDHHSNVGSPYLGCVNAVNLQNMVADPHDLEHGRTLGAANGERESLGVDAYQRGRIPALKAANTPRPTISLPGLAGGTSP